MFGAAKRDKGFKDYCLILQVHPEADAAMVDAAYWHLAKRYNQAAGYDPNAKAKLEELNEAYIVLGSAQRREEYMKVRAQVLGEGALPYPPSPVPAQPPLTVMSRQRPQERAQAVMHEHRSRFPAKRAFLGATVLLGLLGVALAATVSVTLALVVVGGAVVAIATLTGVVAALRRLSGGGRALRSVRTPGKDDAPLTKIRAQAAQVRDISANGADVIVAAQAESPVAADPIAEIELPEQPDPPMEEAAPEEAAPSAVQPLDHGLRPAEAEEPDTAAELGSPKEQAAEPQRMSDDQVAQIRKQAAAYRRIAQTNAGPFDDGPKSDPVPIDPAQDEKIRAQTERLKAIAEKFNAAKATSSPDIPKEEGA